MGEFALNWNDFRQNICNFLGILHSDDLFTNVTLITEDKQEIKAHKIILSASSNFFMNLLQRNDHPRPIIYMKGISSKDLTSIVSFIYNGQVNILENDMKSFFALAEELEVKGLVEIRQGEILKSLETPTGVNESDVKEVEATEVMKDEIVGEETMIDLDENIMEEYQTNCQDVQAFEEIVSISPSKKVVTVNMLEELDSTIETMIDKVDGAWRCNMCGKITKAKNPMKKHIEALHTEGISHKCHICGKQSKSRGSLQVHISVLHKK